ncbi:MAG: efflux RND transporter permease subunit [Kiritimatiellae bacterium]|nr:efflux RND transporter permease subunit [Kiritimatiellia bacterium]
MSALRKLLAVVLDWPKTTVLLALALVGGGAYVSQRLAVDVFPDIKVPRVTIQTEAGGLTAEEVEQRITVPIESAMNGLKGVTNIRSSSGGGLSFVWVDFDWASDPDSARFRVFERLGQVRESLPKEAEPEIAPVISVSGEIMMVALVSDSTNVTGLALREIAEFSLRNRLLAIPGIAQVVAIGGNLPEYRIGYSPRQLAQYGLGVNDLAEAVGASRTWSSGGYLADVNGEELSVRQVARADTTEDLASVWVPNEAGTPIRLGSVANVSLAGAPRRGSASFNGRDAVVVSIQKAPGGNTLELTKQAERALDEFTLPPGVRIEKDAYRQSDFINLSISNGRNMVRDAALIVVIVLGLTLMSFRALLIVLLTMPVSIGAGLILFPHLGLGVNIMTLGGLAVAVGDIVDSSIIFTEIFRRRMREHPKADILAAALEVAPGVAFSGLIIVIVFFPLFFLNGMEGEFFKPLAYAYLAVFACSVAAAFLVTPALALLLGRGGPRSVAAADGTEPVPPRVADATKPSRAPFAERVLQWFYTPFLALAVRFPKLVVLFAAALVGTAVWYGARFGSSFLPPFHEDTYTVFVSLVPGTSLAESERVSENVVKKLLEVDGVLSVTRKTGRAERDQHAEPVSASELIVRVDMAKNPDELRAAMNAVIKSVPGASCMIGYPIAHRISAVLSGSAAELSLNVFGDKPEDIRAAAARAKKLLATMPEVGDFQANREILVDTVKIDYDRERLAHEGLTLADAGEQVSAAFNGRVLGTVAEGQNRRDVTLRLEDGEEDEEAVKKLLIKTRTGRFVRLDDIADVHREEASNLVIHENGRRQALITLNPAPGVSVGELVNVLAQRLGPELATFGCTAEFGGTYQANISARRTLMTFSVVLLFVVFFVLLVATKAPMRAVTVMATLPLALVGAVGAVALTGRIVSIASAVGLITVAGFVIRNGLLLENRYAELEREGHGPIEAIRLGSRERMVPILMTSLTTVFGLVPIVAALDVPGGEILAPLAAVQLGGLVVATVAALVLVPSLSVLAVPKANP